MGSFVVVSYTLDGIEGKSWCALYTVKILQSQLLPLASETNLNSWNCHISVYLLENTVSNKPDFVRPSYNTIYNSIQLHYWHLFLVIVISVMWYYHKYQKFIIQIFILQHFANQDHEYQSLWLSNCEESNGHCTHAFLLNVYHIYW